MRRDINKVIAFMVRHVIPESETNLRTELEELYRRCFFSSPEMQANQRWREFAAILYSHLGDPTIGDDWKSRVGRIVRDEEKVPDEFKELQPRA